MPPSSPPGKRKCPRHTVGDDALPGPADSGGGLGPDSRGLHPVYRQFHVLGMDFRTSTQSTVAALIGMIPEGLYLLTSVAMAVSAMKLAQQKVLVQDMNCIETLARVDVLCVDKTGTITEPGMEVQDLIPLTSRTPQSVWSQSWPPCTAAQSRKTTQGGPWRRCSPGKPPGSACPGSPSTPRPSGPPPSLRQRAPL